MKILVQMLQEGFLIGESHICSMFCTDQDGYTSVKQLTLALHSIA